MSALHLLALFFSAAFFTNALPHLIAGILGRPFQTPFAKPSGKGLSTSRVNVLWAFFNLAVAYLLFARATGFSHHAPVAAFACGLALMSLAHVRFFAPFHGGASPTEPR